MIISATAFVTCFSIREPLRLQNRVDSARPLRSSRRWRRLDRCSRRQIERDGAGFGLMGQNGLRTPSRPPGSRSRPPPRQRRRHRPGGRMEWSDRGPSAPAWRPIRSAGVPSPETARIGAMSGSRAAALISVAPPRLPRRLGEGRQGILEALDRRTTGRDEAGRASPPAGVSCRVVQTIGCLPLARAAASRASTDLSQSARPRSSVGG